MTSFYSSILKIHLSYKCLLTNYYVSGAWDMPIDNTAPHEAHSIEPKTDIEPGITRMLFALFQL